MALEDNYGTQYYAKPTGIPSDVDLLVGANSGTKYYRNSANEFILWGQPSQYVGISTNIGSQYYFLQCDVPSDGGLVLDSNYSTKYYYSSSFNCVSF